MAVTVSSSFVSVGSSSTIPAVAMFVLVCLVVGKKISYIVGFVCL
jgi:hypothetical protein